MLQERHTLTISQAAEALGVSPGWLRFGERLGSLPLARRTSGGHCRYSRSDIEDLRQLGVGVRKKALAERGGG